MAVERKICQLGDLIQLQRGHDLTRSEMEQGNYPIAGSNGIIGYHKDFTTNGPGITIGRSGNIGNVFFYKNDFWAHNTTLYVKSFDNCDPKFIYYLLKTLNFRGHNSGSAVPSLNRNYLHPIEVSVPKKRSDQEEIAQILSSLDNKIELNLQMNETLEKMAQELFNELNSKESKVNLSNLIDLNPRVSLKKGEEAKYLGMAEVPEKGMSIREFIYREFTSGTKFELHDILLARITPCLENGKTAFVDFLEENEVGFGSTEFIVMRAKQGISPYFVYTLARNSRFREYAIQSMTGTSGRQRVQTDRLNHFEIGDISEDEMITFNETVKPLFDRIKTNSDENRGLAQIRDSLLPRLMSGKIEIN